MALKVDDSTAHGGRSYGTKRESLEEARLGEPLSANRQSGDERKRMSFHLCSLRSLRTRVFLLGLDFKSYEIVNLIAERICQVDAPFNVAAQVGYHAVDDS